MKQLFGRLYRRPGSLLDWCWARSICVRCREVFTYRDHGQAPPRYCGETDCEQQAKETHGNPTA